MMFHKTNITVDQHRWWAPPILRLPSKDNLISASSKTNASQPEVQHRKFLKEKPRREMHCIAHLHFSLAETACLHAKGLLLCSS